MKPRISLLTLAVEDLTRSMAFYRELGFATPGVVGQEYEHGSVVFFELEGGLNFALWQRKDLLHDTGLADRPRSGAEFSIGHNVDSRAEVDEVMRQAAAAGAKILKQAGQAFWGGYSGYFQDPDGHIWEVAWNPQMVVV
jgi:uncharacterized protein